RALVGNGEELLEIGDGGLVKGGGEKSQTVQCSQLIVRGAGGIRAVAIELPGAQAQDIIGHRRVTRQTIGRAGIIPSLDCRSARRCNRNVFIAGCGQQVGLIVVWPPLISKTINRSIYVTHQQPGDWLAG
ncbi:hypothetical protein B4Q13_23665, partial [Lacticaseibacillus rhamnosus]